MLILGIESSCDDTASAIVKDGRTVISSVVASQDAVHSAYGGVVPELASRRHIEMIIPVVEESLKRAAVSLSDIDAIGVTQGPGLVGSILVGLSFAKAVGYAKKKPFVGVNHISSHALSAFLEDGEKKEVPDFPFVALIVSGGHTALLSVDDYTEFKILGQTRDDSAGEAFDKVAKLMGLGYPGGVEIDKLAKQGDPSVIEFKRPIIAKGSLEFSFSGLKTAVLQKVKGAELNEDTKRNIAAGFQEAIVDVLVEKAMWAIEATGVKNMVVAGGVACNSRLRQRISEVAVKNNIRLFIPPPRFCSDNGAMVALSAYHIIKKKGAGAFGNLNLNADPSLEF